MFPGSGERGRLNNGAALSASAQVSILDPRHTARLSSGTGHSSTVIGRAAVLIARTSAAASSTGSVGHGTRTHSNAGATATARSRPPTVAAAAGLITATGLTSPYSSDLRAPRRSRFTRRAGGAPRGGRGRGSGAGAIWCRPGPSARAGSAPAARTERPTNWGTLTVAGHSAVRRLMGEHPATRAAPVTATLAAPPRGGPGQGVVVAGTTPVTM